MDDTGQAIRDLTVEKKYPNYSEKMFAYRDSNELVPNCICGK